MQEQATGNEFGTVRNVKPRRIGLLEVAISLVCYLGLSVVAGVALVAAGYDVASQGPVVTLWLVAVAATVPIVGVGVALLPRVRSWNAVGLRGTSVRWLLAGAGVGLITPFGEELLFRGTLYTWLRRWGIVLATAVSAVVFGLFHGVNVVLPAAIVLGVLCALLYERSGSIWPAVVAHAVNNTLIFALARIAAELGLLDGL